MSESLKRYGFETMPYNSEADCYVINTCTVTGDADLSSRQLIRRAKRRNTDAKIIVTGCYAHLRPEEMQKLKVDLIISNREKDTLPHEVLKLFGIVKSEEEIPLSDHNLVISGMNGLTRAFVKIEEGCDEQCTFCTIWMARGPVISRPADIIIKEINALVSNGYKEVALTGIHIGKYDDRNQNLSGLLRTILNQTSIKRIRLSSLNPIEVDDDLISLLASDIRLCPHIHLSIQSGDDKILKAMRRKYDSKLIVSVIEKLIKSIPNITIGADFIVGFPGETDDNFKNTYDLVKSSELHHLHVFPYSDRPGTRASNLGEKVAVEIRAGRTKSLRRLGRECKRAHLANFIGKKLSVLIENRVSRNDGMMTGLSENYLRVAAREIPQFKGKIIDVYPYAIQNDILIADIVNNNEFGKLELTII